MAQDLSGTAAQGKKRRWLGTVAAATVLAGALLFAYARYGRSSGEAGAALLEAMPTDATAVTYVDLHALRQTPFFAELASWAPRPATDSDYAQFVAETGFDYERDLDRVAVAITKSGAGTSLLAVAEGRFDRKKILSLAARNGSSEKRDGREIWSMNVPGSPKRIALVFLGDRRIALTDDPDLSRFFRKAPADGDGAEWQKRFRRLAGSPVFAAIRQEAGSAEALARSAPGSLRSPQLVTLLKQVEWITVAGKPEQDRLRVVVEGESRTEEPARRLGEVLNGLMVLAEDGLNQPATRQQLDPQTRLAYLDLIKTAEVTQVDRGRTKSVRLVFDVAPQFLKVARLPSPAPETARPPSGAPPGRKPGTRKAD